MFARCRLLQKLKFAVGFFLIWAVGLFIVWRTWGSCAPLLTSYSCFNSKVASESSDQGTVKNQNTPVYVVEEHHEVLIYWFDAAEKGLIKRQGNVLLHIDGHSDGAIPIIRNILPLFRWPASRDVYSMMQRNDVFISAASFTGLIKRYIWVWSPWDVDEGEPVMSDHHVISVQQGVITRTGLDGNPMEDVCMCLRSLYENSVIPTEDVCFMMNLTHPNEEGSHIDIEQRECEIKIKDGLAEIVSESKAIELMRSGQWITSLDNVILDIDEDYYGCEAAVQPLYDVHITEHKLAWIRYYIGHLFCPSRPREEFEADKFYARLLDTLINLRRFCQHMGTAAPLCEKESSMRQYIFNITRDVFTDIVQRNLHPSLCKSDKMAKLAIAGLLRHVFPLSVEQLTALKEVGICLTQTPRSYLYDPSLGMKPCDGYNRPNETVVLFHSPTLDEVTFRTSQLKAMLSSEGLHPGVVTVCRSMRDGYTPRKFFHKIETDVLGVLKDVFKTVDENSIFYDQYLLGGVNGWPGRH